MLIQFSFDLTTLTGGATWNSISEMTIGIFVLTKLKKNFMNVIKITYLSVSQLGWTINETFPLPHRTKLFWQPIIAISFDFIFHGFSLSTNIVNDNKGTNLDRCSWFIITN